MQTEIVVGFPIDGFCSGRKFHVSISNDTIAPGWHMSVRPFCSEAYGGDPKPVVSRGVWLPEVIAFYELVGSKWDEHETKPNGVVHFHQRIGKDS